MTRLPAPDAAALDIVLLRHPAFLGLRSQDAFADLLATGLRAAGHRVQARAPQARVQAWVAGSRWPPLRRLGKWAGYVDQYLLFPRQLRTSLQGDAPGTLYVVCDQALGPWVPVLAGRPHVVHCHDLLALRSALGELPEHRTGWTGRRYQRFIRRGFTQARHFIAISSQTRAELQRLAGVPATRIDVVLNGLPRAYAPPDEAAARARLAAAGHPCPEAGFLLHASAGQWYKNVPGLVHLHAAHARRCLALGRRPPELWLVMPALPPAVQAAMADVPAQAPVRWLPPVDGGQLQDLYGLAAALLFPSLEEGFGWPIAEALASGCPVVTTDAAPMTEVGGPWPLYLPRWCPPQPLPAWAEAAAPALEAFLQRPAAQRRAQAAEAAAWAAQRYDPTRALQACLASYRRALTPDLAGSFQSREFPT